MITPDQLITLAVAMVATWTISIAAKHLPPRDILTKCVFVVSGSALVVSGLSFI